MPTLCNEGRTNIGDVYLKATAKSSYYLGLYKNVTEPDKTKVMTDITEADTPGQHGYARVQLLDADWTEQATPGVFKNLQKTFTASGAAWGSIYGYFITTAATGTAGKLVTAESFSDGPYTVNDGWSAKVTPQLSIRDLVS